MQLLIRNGINREAFSASREKQPKRIIDNIPTITKTVEIVSKFFGK